VLFRSKVTRARSVKHTAQTTANTKDADNENDAEDEEARRQLEQQSETKVQNEIMMLYGASQAALNSVHHMMNILNYKVDSLTRAIESNVYPLFCHQQQSLNHSTWLQGFAPTQRSRSSVHNNKSNTASSRPVTAFPNIPAKLPDKLLTLVDQHVSLDLKKFEHAKKDLWPSQTSMAYSRRKYIFSQVEEKARSLITGEWEEKLKEAAMVMDYSRIPCSLKMYKKRIQLLRSGKVAKDERILTCRMRFLADCCICFSFKNI